MTLLSRELERELLVVGGILTIMILKRCLPKLASDALRVAHTLFLLLPVPLPLVDLGLLQAHHLGQFDHLLVVPVRILEELLL